MDAADPGAWEWEGLLRDRLGVKCRGSSGDSRIGPVVENWVRCFDLGIDIIAVGIETEEEYAWPASQGIHLFQGYLFAKPGFESFPPVHYPGP
jgi:EAL domain-containing protein (putative c-di-GMP-specific phosphodiesterase class I)